MHLDWLRPAGSADNYRERVIRDLGQEHARELAQRGGDCSPSGGFLISPDREVDVLGEALALWAGYEEREDMDLVA